MIPFPDKKYNIVYADPPWQYNESWGNGQVGYDTMTNDDICKLPVRDIQMIKHIFICGSQILFLQKD